MNTHSTTVRIGSIIFDNQDTKVLIKGETFKNHLSYASEMFISFSELNLLLNHLQTKNPAVQISEMFEEEEMGGDYSQTTLDAKKLDNHMVDLSFLSFGMPKKLIRA